MPSARQHYRGWLHQVEWERDRLETRTQPGRFPGRRSLSILTRCEKALRTFAQQTGLAEFADWMLDFDLLCSAWIADSFEQGGFVPYTGPRVQLERSARRAFCRPATSSSGAPVSRHTLRVGLSREPRPGDRAGPFPCSQPSSSRSSPPVRRAPQSRQSSGDGVDRADGGTTASSAARRSQSSRCVVLRRRQGDCEAALPGICRARTINPALASAPWHKSLGSGTGEFASWKSAAAPQPPPATFCPHCTAGCEPTSGPTWVRPSSPRLAGSLPPSKACAFKRFDLERDPEEQGFAGERFDIVIASNVIHATADLRQTLDHLRSLLAQGALLLAAETTGKQPWIDLTVGFTEGWWRFSDREPRHDYPLIGKQPGCRY